MKREEVPGLVKEGKVEVCDARMEGKSLMKELGVGIYREKNQRKSVLVARGEGSRYAG